MSTVLAAYTSDGCVGRWRTALADARLEREFEALRGQMARLARHKYRLPWEDCEELAADILLTWHDALCRPGGVREDAAFLRRVLHSLALDRKKALARAKRHGEIVPLAEVENRGFDPHIDARVAECEELRHLAELVKDVLSDRERGVLALSKLDFSRAEIGERHGLSVRQVERWLDRSQRKLDEALRVMSERGRCRMLALTIADIKTGRIGPEHSRYAAGAEHLDECWRCRASTPTWQAQAASRRGVSRWACRPSRSWITWR